MNDLQEPQEEDRLSTFKEDALIIGVGVVIFNILLAILWVIYIFRSYTDYDRYNITQREFAWFDGWMRYSIPLDIAVGVFLNIVFIAFLYRWLKKFRAGKKDLE